MIAQKKISILIIDTNIFLKGIDINIFKEKMYTTHKIIDEINVLKYQNKNRNIINRIEVAINKEQLIIRDPKEEYINRTIDASKITGDVNALSKADIELIALALELMETSGDDITLYSNDYTVQNLCSEMNIKFNSIFKKGIKNQKKFELFCPSCREKYSAENMLKYCEVCGSKLKRRTIKRE